MTVATHNSVKPESMGEMGGIVDSAFTRRVCRLVDVLRSSGLEQELELPTIAIIGSQSAGKSSVMEAITGIAFPRSSGTCTRAPTQITLSQASSWRCDVFVRIVEDEKGNAVLNGRDVPFGSPILDPSEVGERISQAQRAALNPSKDAKLYLAKTESEANERSFSENIIVLKLQGPSFVNLSFVDLPGIIANVGEGEDPRNIDLIKSLAAKTIARPSVIILSCISMGEDFQTAAGVMLARKADPDGQRTLGVLTKPDLIEVGRMPEWEPIVKGDKERLALGYYVVKNPSPSELQANISPADAREGEQRFFRTKEDWQRLPRDVQNRLGIRALALRLSQLMEGLLRMKLPDITAKLRDNRNNVASQLGKLPREVKPAEAFSKVTGLVQDFGQALQVKIKGMEGDTDFVNDLHAISLEFARNIVYTRPRIAPFTKQQLEHRGDIKDFFQESPLDDTGNMYWDVAYLDINLTDIEERKKRATVLMLPMSTPWEVKRPFMSEAHKDWERITVESFAEVKTLISAECEKLVSTCFAGFFAGGLGNAVNSSIDSLINDQGDKAMAFLMDLVKLEETIYTLNNDLFLPKRSEILEAYYAARKEAHKAYPEAGILELKEKDEDEDADDPMEETLAVAAEVCAYWNVAHQRFIDYVRNAIFVHFTQPIAAEAIKRILGDLGLYSSEGDERAQAFLAEDADTIRLRLELSSRKDSLDCGLRAMRDFTCGVTA